MSRTAPIAPERYEEEALAVLKKHWGYDGFRSGQWNAMEAVLTGNDALTILPTGGGKSLCYQIPALVLEGLTLVVSPLVALMDDQVAQLRRRGVRATFINSTLSHRQIEERWNEAMFGGLKLLYLAPERLQTDVFRARAERLNVSLLAVDEAHCISEWGHSFRPAYLRIAEARRLIGDPPTIAVTATATPYVRRDIEERLELRAPVRIVTGFDRPNLTWSIFRTENKRGKVLEILKAVPGCGIVYAGTRKGTEEWATWLDRQGISAACYHGGLPADARSTAQACWIRGEKRVMVATNAFGMGIDKPDVRFVVHVDLPSSLESYYQEAGRGGRDGARAHAVLIYRPGDEDTPRRLLERSHPDRQTVRRVHDVLCSMHGVALGELPDEALPADPESVARAAGVDASAVEAVLEMLARQDVLSLRRPDPDSLLIRFLASREAVRDLARTARNDAMSRFVTDLMRCAPPESFDTWTELPRAGASRRLSLDAARLERGLDFLRQRELLAWHAGGRTILVSLNAPRSAHVPYDEAAAAQARRRSETRLDDMVRYARSPGCRRRFLLSYFGETSPERCGTCDVCLGRHEPIVVLPEHEPTIRHILNSVHAGTERNAWFGERSPRHRDVDALVDWLIRESYLRIANPLEERFELTEKARRLGFRAE